MKKMTDGRFKCTFILKQFLSIPAGKVIKKLEVTARKKNWASSDDQTSKTFTIPVGCQ
jgi:predicted acetyltransferase